MSGEYKGKSLFSRRYIGMSEEAIRDEIDRLQGQVYELEKALDALKADDKDFADSIAENQIKMEKLVKSMDEKLTKLQSSLDYDAPIKNQIDNLTKDISTKVQAYNKDMFIKLARVMQFDTVLLIVLFFLFIYKSIV